MIASGAVFVPLYTLSGVSPPDAPDNTTLPGPCTQATLDAVAVQLNGRPRQRHNWKTPAEELDLILSEAA